MKRVIDLDKLNATCIPRELAPDVTQWVHPDGRPVRDVMKPNALNRTVRAPCVKAGRDLHVEGPDNEALAVMWYDINPSVLDVIEQPEVIEFKREDGRETFFVPDFLVRRVGDLYRREEVKSALAFVKDPDLQAKLDRNKAIYARGGLEYRLLVVNRIDHRSFWDNVRIVASKRGYTPDEGDVERVRLHLAAKGGVSTLGACIKHVKHDPVDPFDTVLAMMPRRLVRIQLKEPLGLHSRVELVLS
ncbi:hypothetical protein C4E04_10305 [Microvirga sp. 17 mud 1-3]|nr:hypothetical protein C4E04_10305 [Microvirga sp. 17 mud 1-3]